MQIKLTTTTLSLLLVTLLSTGQQGVTAMPSVKEYYSFGENQPLIQLLQANIGITFAYYRGLLQRETPLYRADECYRNLWEVADGVISSFNLLGYGQVSQYVAFGVSTADLGYKTYSAAVHCLPLFKESPPTFDPIVLSDAGFYFMKVLRIVENLFFTLVNTDGVTFYKDITEIIMNVEDIIRRAV
eukprot:403364413